MTPEDEKVVVRWHDLLYSGNCVAKEPPLRHGMFNGYRKSSLG